MKDLTTETIKKNWKRYLFSSLITFLTGFLMVFVSEIDALSLDSFKDGSLLGLFFVGIRTGVKMAMEYILLIFSE